MAESTSFHRYPFSYFILYPFQVTLACKLSHPKSKLGETDIQKSQGKLKLDIHPHQTCKHKSVKVSYQPYKQFHIDENPPMLLFFPLPHKSKKFIVIRYNIVTSVRQYYVEYSPCSDWMWEIFHKILSIPQNTVMDSNNVSKTWRGS